MQLSRMGCKTELGSCTCIELTCPPRAVCDFKISVLYIFIFCFIGPEKPLKGKWLITYLLRYVTLGL